VSFEGHYSWLDRLIHRFAFVTWPAQLALADFENRLFRHELASLDVRKPVFITGLPRAGTTLLLEVCTNLGEFATHTYRHMPFVLLPMLWRRVSAPFWRRAKPMERAHGDGMQVSVDSPESFEEVVWRPFWRDHYKQTRIVPWGREENSSFSGFFRDHIRKIIALEQHGRDEPWRYISKNNLNIARLTVVRLLFPDAIIVVPFRDPVQHAVSMLRQHQNFLALHGKDAFPRKYMADIGHYDFGANLKPIDFDHWLPEGWLPGDPGLSAGRLEFWLRYWTAAYENLLNLRGTDRNIRFVCFETLCQSPHKTLGELAEWLGVRDPDALIRQSDRIKGAPSREPSEVVDRSIISGPTALYAELRDAG
jgi:hypothetical protein